MKKIKYILFLLIVVLTGCGRTEHRFIDDSVTNLVNEKNYKININFSYDDSNTKLSGKGILFGSNKDYNLKIDYKYNDIENSIDSYLLSQDKYSSIYFNDNSIKNILTKEYLDKLNKCISERKEIISDKDGYAKYEITINKTNLKKNIGIDNPIIDNILSDKNVKKFIFIAYVKGEYISSIEIDLSKINKNLNGNIKLEVYDIDVNNIINLPNKIEKVE